MRKKTKDKETSRMLKNVYEKVSGEIVLSAKLNRLYADKVSCEIVNEKVTHQLNAMEASIHQINPKFQPKSKNYDKVREEMAETLKQYEEILKRLADKYDVQIEKLIFKKVELEAKLLMTIITKEYLAQKETEKSEEYQDNQQFLLKLQKEVKHINKKIRKLNQEKEKQILEAMEVGGKELSVQIRKPRKIKSLTKFFMGRFNTYKVIMKNVIEPFKQRIDEFKVNELKKVDGKPKELKLAEVEEKIVSIKKSTFAKIDNKIICKEMGIL